MQYNTLIPIVLLTGGGGLAFDKDRLSFNCPNPLYSYKVIHRFTYLVYDPLLESAHCIFCDKVIVISNKWLSIFPADPHHT